MHSTNVGSTLAVVKSPMIQENESKSEVSREESEVLDVYRRAKNLGYAEIAISIQEGNRVKLWLTEKMR